MIFAMVISIWKLAPPSTERRCNSMNSSISAVAISFPIKGSTGKMKFRLLTIANAMMDRDGASFAQKLVQPERKARGRLPAFLR
ncbi:hypothetical protein D3C77_634880 [compost metagenome]